MRHAYANAYQTFWNFGLTPASDWPINISGSGTYLARINIQTETDNQVLCGASGDIAYRFGKLYR